MTIYVLVLPTRVPRTLTTGWLIKSLTSFAQHTRLKFNRSYIAPECWGSRSDRSLNGHLHYPNDVDRPLNEDVVDKIRAYHTNYNNRPSNDISFMTAIVNTSGRIHSEFVCHLFFQTHRETDRIFASSGVQLAQSTSGQFHNRRVVLPLCNRVAPPVWRPPSHVKTIMNKKSYESHRYTPSMCHLGRTLREKNEWRGEKGGGRWERMKRGRGMKVRMESSSLIVTLISEVLTKIKPKDPLRLVK